MWGEILTAVALVLVLEGLLPFANPEGWRDAMRRLLEVEPARLRMAGLGSMLVGTLLLLIVH